jgi:hypothetical protein
LSASAKYQISMAYVFQDSIQYVLGGLLDLIFHLSLVLLFHCSFYISTAWSKWSRVGSMVLKPFLRWTTIFLVVGCSEAFLIAKTQWSTPAIKSFRRSLSSHTCDARWGRISMTAGTDVDRVTLREELIQVSRSSRFVWTVCFIPL